MFTSDDFTEAQRVSFFLLLLLVVPPTWKIFILGLSRGKGNLSDPLTDSVVSARMI